MNNNDEDEIIRVLPGIWIRKSQRDIMNEWEKEQSKRFCEFMTTGKLEPETDTMSNKTDNK